MKLLNSLFVSIVSLGVVGQVVAQQPPPSDLAAQLQRLNQAVRGTPAGTQIKPQVSPANLEALAKIGAPPSAKDQQSIAKALESAERTVGTLPPAVQQQLKRAREQAAAGGAQVPGQQQIPVQQSTQEAIPLREEAFIGMSRTQLPLSPDQVKTLKKMFTNVQRAAAAHPGAPPRPTSTSLVVNLSPGATPPVIRLQAGFVSSLVFLDASGTAWPVSAYDLGDPRSFNIQWNKKSNTLMVQAISQYKVGNLAVVLEGLTTPIMITLIPGQKAVDYRVDLRLPVLGPNAHIMSSSLPGKSDPQLLNVLNGVSPSGSRELEVSGGVAQVWKYHGKFFVRTRMTILSPGWISHLRSADGMNAYHLNKTPVILASENGKMHKLIVRGL